MRRWHMVRRMPGANALYRSAYAAASALDETATQAEVDNAAQNLLAGLEQAGKLRYPQNIYTKETAEPSFLLGDADGNGRLDASDVYQSMLGTGAERRGRIQRSHHVPGCRSRL